MYTLIVTYNDGSFVVEHHQHADTCYYRWHKLYRPSARFRVHPIQK